LHTTIVYVLKGSCGQAGISQRPHDTTLKLKLSLTFHLTHLWAFCSMNMAVTVNLQYLPVFETVVLEVWIRSGLATRAAHSLPLLDQLFRLMKLEVYLLRF
jgi:hypothetical protein